MRRRSDGLHEILRVRRRGKLAVGVASAAAAVLVLVSSAKLPELLVTVWAPIGLVLVALAFVRLVLWPADEVSAEARPTPPPTPLHVPARDRASGARGA